MKVIQFSIILGILEIVFLQLHTPGHNPFPLPQGFGRSFHPSPIPFPLLDVTVQLPNLCLFKFQAISRAKLFKEEQAERTWGLWRLKTTFSYINLEKKTSTSTSIASFNLNQPAPNRCVFIYPVIKYYKRNKSFSRCLHQTSRISDGLTNFLYT